MISVGKQKGMTGIGWMFVFMLIGATTLLVLKLFPLYSGGMTVTSALHSLESEHNIGKKTPGQIKTMLLKRLDINMVTDVTKDDIYIERAGGAITVEVDYEVRKNLAGNLDVVVVFNEKIVLPSN